MIKKLFAVVVLLNEALWAKNDSIMADRGILISNDLESIGVSFNISAFLNGSDQLTKAEVKESQAIASVRIYVESNTACKKVTSTQE